MPDNGVASGIALQLLQEIERNQASIGEARVFVENELPNEYVGLASGVRTLTSEDLGSIHPSNSLYQTYMDSQIFGTGFFESPILEREHIRPRNLWSTVEPVDVSAAGTLTMEMIQNTMREIERAGFASDEYIPHRYERPLKTKKKKRGKYADSPYS